MALELQIKTMGEEEEEEQVGMKNKKPSSVSLDLNKASTLISDHLHNPSSSISPNHPPSEDPLAQEPKSNPEQESKEIKSPTNEEPPLFLNPNPNIPGSDLEKKFRRAERFGMPVQLSEEEKRTSRAERFGSKSITRGSEVMKKSEEEQKRKARAERFGLPANSIVDEESKKKARLARFAPVGKLDSAEEDKKKVRALRFSQTSTSSPSSQENGKAKTEPIPT